MNEIWKPIPGFKKYYAVSNKGGIKRLADGHGPQGQHSKAGRILKTTLTSGGYMCIELYIMGVPYYENVHVLVALAFIGPKPTPKHEVAHWNGKRSDNRVRNLRWATRKSNKADSIRHGTSLKGMKHPLAKVTDRQVLKIKDLRSSGWLLRELKEKFHISESRISKLCTGVVVA